VQPYCTIHPAPAQAGERLNFPIMSIAIFNRDPAKSAVEYLHGRSKQELKMLEIKRINWNGFVSFAVIDISMNDAEIVRFEHYYDAVDFIRCMEGL